MATPSPRSFGLMVALIEDNAASVRHLICAAAALGAVAHPPSSWADAAPFARAS